MTDERLIMRPALDQSEKDSVSQLSPSDVSISNLEIPGTCKFFEDSKVVTAPDIKEQPSECAGHPS